MYEPQPAYDSHDSIYWSKQYVTACGEGSVFFLWFLVVVLLARTAAPGSSRGDGDRRAAALHRVARARRQRAFEHPARLEEAPRPVVARRSTSRSFWVACLSQGAGSSSSEPSQLEQPGPGQAPRRSTSAASNPIVSEAGTVGLARKVHDAVVDLEPSPGGLRLRAAELRLRSDSSASATASAAAAARSAW